jgi:hypothetical protein
MRKRTNTSYRGSSYRRMDFMTEEEDESSKR